jgi:hypothetical protein
MPRMATGSVSSSSQSAASREREEGSLGFDPRPWPLVVGLLAALFAVYFALRPPSATPENGNGGTGTTRATRTTRAAGAVAAAVVVPALADSKEVIEQGITLRLEQGGKTDLRSARVMSLYVPEHSAPTPFLQPGPFTATFTGFVNLRLRGEFTFSVLGRGKVVLKIKGQPVLEAAGDDFAGKASALLKMEKGRNPIEVVYTSPQRGGDAWLRVLWTSR